MYFLWELYILAQKNELIRNLRRLSPQGHTQHPHTYVSLSPIPFPPYHSPSHPLPYLLDLSCKPSPSLPPSQKGVRRCRPQGEK
jgi:hypothetical protein